MPLPGLILAPLRLMALTPQQTEELRGLIHERLQRLAADIRDDRARSREDRFQEIAGPAPDAGDASVATLIRDLDQADLTRDLDEARGLEAAIDRIAAGRYGVCADCAGDIGYERLRAEPSALRCIECQRRREKTFAGATRATL